MSFRVRLIQWNAIHRTYLTALGHIEMTDAFGAQIRVDLVDFFALENGVIRTLWLTYITVDAGVGDFERHNLLQRENKAFILTLLQFA
jgi:hypothetical protein